MSQKNDTRDISRRSVLKGTAATGAVVGVGGTAVGGYRQLLSDLDVEATTQNSEATRRFELLGIVSGWIGVDPAEIDPRTNPALRLVEGKEYEVFWINGDGNHHNFNILDEEGNALESTGTLIEQGASETLEFTAEPEMASYKCFPHPVQMWGPIEFVDASDVHELTVVVEDGNGNPLAAKVSVGGDLHNLMSPTTGFSTILARGDANTKNAQIRFDTLENGTYTVTSWTYGHEMVTQEVTIDGSDQEITLTLPEVTPGEPAQVYELSLHENGWQGVAPDSIAGQSNPPLRVTPGETYRVTWTNEIPGGLKEIAEGPLQSEPLPGHNFVVARQNNSTILRSEFLTEEGQTQSVDFVAEDDLGTYLDQSQLGASGEIIVE